MCSIYLENINFLYFRNIVTSIFLKLDYIYFIKLIKQIKYIIPLQKQIKLDFKILNTCIIKRTTITFLSNLKTKKQT
jgi:hypothetical protein